MRKTNREYALTESQERTLNKLMDAGCSGRFVHKKYFPGVSYMAVLRARKRYLKEKQK